MERPETDGRKKENKDKCSFQLNSFLDEYWRVFPVFFQFLYDFIGTVSDTISKG